MTTVISRSSFIFFVAIMASILCVSLLSNEALALVAEAEVAVSVETKPTTTLQIDAQQKARANTQADRAALREELTASTAKKRAEVQEQVAKRKATLETKSQERVTALAGNMSTRMESVIKRLQNITDRLESRIIKLNDAGVNTTSSAAALASAQLSLNAAQAEISDIDVMVYEVISSNDIHTGWTSLKTKFSNIKNFIKTAHRELRTSITLLKEATLEARAQQHAQVDTE